jgi:hypothetical protein
VAVLVAHVDTPDLAAKVIGMEQPPARSYAQVLAFLREHLAGLVCPFE